MDMKTSKCVDLIQMREWKSTLRTSLVNEVGVVKWENGMLMVKEGGSMSYQVPVLTPMSYLVGAVKVKSIMDARNI